MNAIYFVELRDGHAGEPYWALSTSQEHTHMPPSYHTLSGYRWWGHAENPGQAMRNARRKRRFESQEEM